MNSFTVKMVSFIAMPFLVYFVYYQRFFQWVHVELTGHEYPLTTYALWYMAMTALHLAYYTEEKTELKVCGKNTGIMIEHGWFWLTNLGHLTITLFSGFAILCGVRVPSDERARLRGRTNIEHHSHQLLNSYRVNIDVGPFTALMMKLSEATGLWIFKTPHLVPMRLGFLGMCIFLLVSLGDRAFSTPRPAVVLPTISLPSLPDFSRVSAVFKLITDAAKPKEVSQPLVQLFAGSVPADPPARLFVSTKDKDVQYYETIGDHTYYLYSAPSVGYVDGFIATKKACKLIPPGMGINVWSKYPPTSFRYMGKVTYYRTTPRTWWFGSEKIEKVTTSWQELERSWQHVREDGDREKVLQSESLPKHRAPNAPGGMICF